MSNTNFSNFFPFFMLFYKLVEQDKCSNTLRAEYIQGHTKNYTFTTHTINTPPGSAYTLIKGFTATPTSTTARTKQRAKTTKISEIMVQNQTDLTTRNDTTSRSKDTTIESQTPITHKLQKIKKKPVKSQISLASNPILKYTYRIKNLSQKNTQKPTAAPKLHNKLTNKPKLFPTSIPLQDDIGKFGLMWPRGCVANAHPAAQMLKEFSEVGCPVDTGRNWTHEELQAAIKRGPHISAKDPHALECLHEEMDEKLKGGYLQKTTWGKIKTSYPKNFKISPLAMM